MLQPAQALVWLLHEAVKCELEDEAAKPQQADVDESRVSKLCASLGADDLTSACARVAAKNGNGDPKDARLFYVSDFGGSSRTASTACAREGPGPSRTRRQMLR